MTKLKSIWKVSQFLFAHPGEQNLNPQQNQIWLNLIVQFLLCLRSQSVHVPAWCWTWMYLSNFALSTQHGTSRVWETQPKSSETLKQVPNFYFESHKIHLIATPGFRRLWLHRFLVTPKTRKSTQLRVQLHPAARSTASAANVARPWRRMFQRFGQRMVDGWNQRYGILSPWIARYFADCWIFHVIFVQDFMKQKVGVQVITSGKKRKGSRTQSLPYSLFMRC